MKIAVNKQYGGFVLSKAALNELGLNKPNYGCIDNSDFNISEDEDYYKHRTNKKLIEAIEKIGEEESCGRFGRLRIIEIPDDVKWEIVEVGGYETIHEKHRVW